jgi:hypothetical protein
MTPSNLTELQGLLGNLREEQLTPERAVRLDEILSADPEARLFYVRYMDLCANLFWLTISDDGQRRLMAQIQRNNREVLDLGLQESVSSPIPPSLGILPHHTVGNFSSGWPVAYLIATAIVGVGLLIGALVHVSQPFNVVRQSPLHTTSPSTLPAVVARITATVDCVWEGSGGRGQGRREVGLPSPGTDRKVGHGRGVGGEGGTNSLSVAMSLSSKSPLHLGDRLALRSGLLEITYDTGAKVILQGPVTYDVESPTGGYLSVGKLTARLDSHSEISNLKSQISNHLSEIINHQFAVRTPTAVVTDLGTEFGVEVDKSGATRSAVFRGSVRVQRLSADGTREKAGLVLHENQSTRVESNDAEIIVVPIAKSSGFIRNIPKRTIKILDLADVVAGGNGCGRTRNRGIHPVAGTSVAMPTDTPGSAPEFLGDRRYHKANGFPFVDGVFIPEGSQGPVVADSAGHIFADCPKTDNHSWGHIWPGGVLNMAPDLVLPATLEGVDYSGPDHSVLAMHANKAITFDLGAIRRANRGCTVLRFRAMIGNTETQTVNGKSC